MMMNQIRLAKVEMFTYLTMPHISLNIGCDMLVLQYSQVELNSNLKCVYFYIHYGSFKGVGYPYECIFISLRWRKKYS